MNEQLLRDVEEHLREIFGKDVMAKLAAVTDEEVERCLQKFPPQAERERPNGRLTRLEAKLFTLKNYKLGQSNLWQTVWRQIYARLNQHPADQLGLRTGGQIVRIPPPPPRHYHM
jgi:hypothetical protein